MSAEILIVAGEASSALYAQRLLEYWRSEKQNIHAFGIGTQAMEALGFERLGRSEELAVVGIQEVISHWSVIKVAFESTLNEAKKRKPKLALLLDYPDFNLYLAKKLKKIGIPVVYYISPQVWAWRKGRVHNIKKYVDQMLVLFPFEKEFYQQYGVKCEFVGHPLLDEVAQVDLSPEEMRRSRQRYGISDAEVVLALMPGSRKSEVRHHLKIQIQTAELLLKEHPQLKVVLLVAPTLNKEFIQSHLENLNFPLILIQQDPQDMVKLCDVVLVASGTATLLVGLLEKPMVIMYRMNALTAWLAKVFVKHTRYFGMINLVLNHAVVPEYFQEQATPQKLALDLSSWIRSPERRKETALKLSEAKKQLGHQGATVRVAHILTQYLSSLDTPHWNQEDR